MNLTHQTSPKEDIILSLFIDKEAKVQKNEKIA